MNTQNVFVVAINIKGLSTKLPYKGISPIFSKIWTLLLILFGEKILLFLRVNFWFFVIFRYWIRSYYLVIIYYLHRITIERQRDGQWRRTWIHFERRFANGSDLCKHAVLVVFALPYDRLAQLQ